MRGVRFGLVRWGFLGVGPNNVANNCRACHLLLVSVLQYRSAARIPRLVQWLTTGWTVRGLKPGGGEIFWSRPALGPIQPHMQWVPGLFPRVKRPGLCVDHPPPCSAKVKEGVQVKLYSPCVYSWQAIRWTSAYFRSTEVYPLIDMSVIVFYMPCPVSISQWWFRIFQLPLPVDFSWMSIGLLHFRSSYCTTRCVLHAVRPTVIICNAHVTDIVNQARTTYCTRTLCIEAVLAAWTRRCVVTGVVPLRYGATQ